MTSSSTSSVFRDDATRLEMMMNVQRYGGRLDSETEKQFTQRLRELLPGELFPDDVRFRSSMTFFTYFSQSRANEALTTLRRVIAFDATSPIDQALRAAKPTAQTRSPTNGTNTVEFLNEARASTEQLRAALKRLLGPDNLMLPLDLLSAFVDKSGNVFLEFPTRPALERALRIFGGIPVDTTDPAERSLRTAGIDRLTLVAYALAAGYRGGCDSVCHDYRRGKCDRSHCRRFHFDLEGGGAAVPDASAHRGGGVPVPPPPAPRFRMYRCELCRYELDEREFPPTEIAEHAQAPRCARCCERREAEKRREWEEEQRRAEEQRREEERRVYGDLPAPAGGGAAAYHHPPTQKPPPPHQPPPAHQQFYQYHARQQQEQQQQHDRVGQRHGREDYGDDGFPTRPRGSW